MRVRRWPLHRKIAVGAWIPVIVIGLALFTGPNRSGSASTAAPETTTTVPPLFSPNGPGGSVPSMASQTQDEIIGSWVNGTPSRKTLPQARGVQRFKALRDKTILALHNAAQRWHGAVHRPTGDSSQSGR
jgi:hypothetical protein